MRRRRLSVPYIMLAVALRLMLSGRTIVGAPSHPIGDIQFYYQLARLSDSGLYPFVHFWVEYPPVFPFLLTGLYRLLAVAGLTSTEQFSVAYAAVMSGVDLLNLLLVYRIVRRVRGGRPARWAAVIYAGCPSLVWFSAGWFDALAVLFALLAVDAILNKRAATAGALIGVGVLTKVFPGVLILVAPAALGWRASLRLYIAAIATLAAVLLPLVVIRADLVLAAFASMVNRPAWETIPALVNGYYGWGVQPPLEDRFTGATAFNVSGGSTWISVMFQAVTSIGVWAGWRALRAHRSTPGDVLVVATLGVLAFALGNKGFSPQFIAWLVPFIVMVWPDRIGLMYVAALAGYVLAYEQFFFPPIHEYYVNGTGSIDHVALAAWASVTLRTLLVCCMVGHLLWKIRAFSPSRLRVVAPCSSRLSRRSSFSFGPATGGCIDSHRLARPLSTRTARKPVVARFATRPPAQSSVVSADRYGVAAGLWLFWRLGRI